MSVDWTQDRIKLLSDLWAEGLTAGEIGKRLEVTKNSVVGKVHRLGLPKRPSPIKSSADKPARKPRAKPAPKKVVKESKIITLGALTSTMCSWPHGEPGTAEFQFCGDVVVPGKPYCEDHCARAYVRSSKGGGNNRANSRANSRANASTASNAKSAA